MRKLLGIRFAYRLKRGLKYFFRQFLNGVGYAMIFLLSGGLMGLIYGLFGAKLLSSALAVMSISGLLVILNFPFAALLLIFHLILSLFNKGSRLAIRYFALSTAFLLVYIHFYFILRLSEIQPF
jgi:hypothetical protein